MNRHLSFLLSGLAIIGLMVSLSACQEDDPDDQQPAADPLTLDCDYQGLDKLVHPDSVLTLTDRGSGVDYIINCRADVEGHLIVEPGVTIQFGSGGAINVYGSMEAVGTPDDPVTFTGEDQVRGSWGYIAFDSDDVLNKMQHCIVEYGGGFEFSSNGDRGNVIILGGARASIDDCTLRNSESYGLRIPSHSAEVPSLSTNTMTMNAIPAFIPANHVAAIDGGSYSGNDDDAVVVSTGGFGNSATISSDVSWQAIDVPYRPEKYIRVTSGVLTLEPGLAMTFANGTAIEVGDSDDAGLVCVGTPSDSIRLTGETPAEGAWDGLIFNFTANPLNEVGYTVIQHAASTDAEGAIYTWAAARLNVHDVSFRDLLTCAIYTAPNTSSPNPNLTEANNATVNVGGGYLCGD